MGNSARARSSTAATPLIQGTPSPPPHPRTRGSLWRVSPPPAGAESQGQCTGTGGGGPAIALLSPPLTPTLYHLPGSDPGVFYLQEGENSTQTGMFLKNPRIFTFRYIWIQGLKNISLGICLSHYISALLPSLLASVLKQTLPNHWQMCHPANILSVKPANGRKTPSSPTFQQAIRAGAHWFCSAKFGPFAHPGLWPKGCCVLG